MKVLLSLLPPRVWLAIGGLVVVHLLLWRALSLAESSGRERALSDLQAAALTLDGKADAAANLVRDCYAAGGRWDRGGHRCAR